MQHTRWIAAAAAALALTACGSSEPDVAQNGLATANGADDAVLSGTDNAMMMTPPGSSATADLSMANGAAAGRVTATDSPQGIALALTVTGFDAGQRGVHVHTTGRCDGPDFQTAGGHWNPGSRQHGLENPEGSHAGDMPNLTVAADGTGSLQFTLPNATVASMLEGDGSAFVVHAGLDDQRTDPSGDSGDRIACGVFRAT